MHVCICDFLLRALLFVNLFVECVFVLPLFFFFFFNAVTPFTCVSGLLAESWNKGTCWKNRQYTWNACNKSCQSASRSWLEFEVARGNTSSNRYCYYFTRWHTAACCICFLFFHGDKTHKRCLVSKDAVLAQHFLSKLPSRELVDNDSLLVTFQLIGKVIDGWWSLCLYSFVFLFHPNVPSEHN